MGFDFFPLWISLRAVLLATAITFFLGLLFAWLISKSNSRLKHVFDGILMLPLVLPPTVTGFFLLLLFSTHGFLGKILLLFDIRVIFSWGATVIAAAVVSFPFMYRTCRGAFELIDENILNAGKTLGASDWKLFWKVAVPLAWPGIVAGTLLAFARALGEFGATLMIAGNIPGQTQTIPMAIYFSAQGGDMHTALIWVLIIFAVSLITMILINYWLESRKNKLLGKK